MGRGMMRIGAILFAFSTACALESSDPGAEPTGEAEDALVVVTQPGSELSNVANEDGNGPEPVPWRSRGRLRAGATGAHDAGAANAEEPEEDADASRNHVSDSK